MPFDNELAAFHRINPATAAKGVNQLVDDGVLDKKRGIGMFVATGAQAQAAGSAGRTSSREQYLQPLLAEAAHLGIRPDRAATIDDPTATRSTL